MFNGELNNYQFCGKTLKKGYKKLYIYIYIYIKIIYQYISKLRNDFLKDRNDDSQIAYRKQRNLCVTLL